MSLISVNNLTFAYSGTYDNIFENVSFMLDTNWKLGFIGRNGKGKTTFLNLLMGKFDYSGTISADVSFEYFPFKITDKTILAIDISKDIIPNVLDWQLKREISLLNLNESILYNPFNTLSNGEQTKLLLAVLFLKENSFLLIDEPTNHLDMDSRKLVSNYLKNKKGFILVSHDKTFVDNCVDHIISINRQDIQIQNGNFSSWLENKEREDNFELNKNEKLKGEIKHLTVATKRTKKWSDDVEATKIGLGLGDRGAIGHKAAKMMKRSKSIEKRQFNAIEEKSKLLKNIEKLDDLKISPLKYFTDTLVKLENITIKYDHRTICQNVSFQVNEGDRVALCGKNGCGKSSIIKLICGEDIEHKGNVIVNNQLKISYINQDTSNLSGTLDDFAEKNNIDETLFKAILRKLDFSRLQFEKPIDAYSEGQKKKVLIAKSLCEKANIYIWDEPLNFIDIFSRIQIEKLLLKFTPTMIFVEHDFDFTEKIATQKIML